MRVGHGAISFPHPPFISRHRRRCAARNIYTHPCSPHLHAPIPGNPRAEVRKTRTCAHGYARVRELFDLYGRTRGRIGAGLCVYRNPGWMGSEEPCGFARFRRNVRVYCARGAHVEFVGFVRDSRVPLRARLRTMKMAPKCLLHKIRSDRKECS